MRRWEGGDPGVSNQKTPTTILLTPERKFHSFGYAARDFYHDLDPNEAKQWLYLEKFKMKLHTTGDLTMDTDLTAANGKKVKALEIFAYALQYFKEQALKELSDQAGSEFENSDVRWVITVPAIWKQPAKQFMRQAAYQAGLASPENSEQLIIALEPEAASIYCRKLRLHQMIELSSKAAVNG
ncbi:heat shock protein family A (Hsp70) member 12A [Homo sapiens]|uniref:Heat shock protein family A (Hsp70) member 12A n=3 Tax=Hominidae TaxID=9604 RepID=A0A6I8PL68_HUMAN|nr:heat shock protein family A (Hsp70) member 12A [Homo sapiens]KAI4077588.1 heat shock protein family A (Hsp70) member 12A [Homo sapiens]